VKGGDLQFRDVHAKFHENASSSSAIRVARTHTDVMTP